MSSCCFPHISSMHPQGIYSCSPAPSSLCILLVSTFPSQYISWFIENPGVRLTLDISTLSFHLSWPSAESPILIFVGHLPNSSLDPCLSLNDFLSLSLRWLFINFPQSQSSSTVHQLPLVLVFVDHSSTPPSLSLRQPYVGFSSPSLCRPSIDSS